MRYIITLIAALIGNLITLVGLAACFLFGLIPILRAIDASPTAASLFFVFVVGFSSFILSVSYLFRIDQETWILDETTRTWIRLP